MAKNLDKETAADTEVGQAKLDPEAAEKNPQGNIGKSAQSLSKNKQRKPRRVGKALQSPVARSKNDNLGLKAKGLGNKKAFAKGI